MIELPREPIPAETLNPKKLLIYGKPKVGKTTLLSGLPNNLIIDLEHGSVGLNNMRVSADSLEDLLTIGKAIKAKNTEEGKNIYRFITIDTLTKFEDYAWQLATQNYKNSLVGRNFTGDSNALKQLPKGAGYPLMMAA